MYVVGTDYLYGELGWFHLVAFHLITAQINSLGTPIEWSILSYTDAFSFY